MISTPEPTTHTTKTITGTKYVTVSDTAQTTSAYQVPISESEDSCNVENVTNTVHVTVLPLPSDTASSEADATVTGRASTVIKALTDTSYTSGLPDATVSGKPLTVTDVRSDVIITSGLPDVTVSGKPTTVTDVQVAYSLTSGRPDATIDGRPSTLTEVDASYAFSTVTATSTTTLMTTVQDSKVSKHGVKTSVVVVTITDLYPLVLFTSAAKGEVNTRSDSAEFTSTFTSVVLITAGPPATSTSTILVPSMPYEGSNATETNYASGTIGSSSTPTGPVIVSGVSGPVKPFGKGIGALVCAVLLLVGIPSMI